MMNRPITLKPTLTVVEVEFTQEGWHNWPAAPEHRAYLRDLHRHLFYVTVAAKVDHHERMIEFHDLLDRAKGLWPCISPDFPDMGARSCETMASELGELLLQDGIPIVYVAVSEDNEVRSVCYWPDGVFNRAEGSDASDSH